MFVEAVARGGCAFVIANEGGLVRRLGIGRPIAFARSAES
jgi:hypothetical protein